MLTNVPQPLLSSVTRVAAVAGALAIIATVTLLAGRASENAVHSAQVAISPPVPYSSGQAVAQACPAAPPHT